MGDHITTPIRKFNLERKQGMKFYVDRQEYDYVNPITERPYKHVEWYLRSYKVEK